MRSIVRLAFAMIALATASTPAAAQQVETPVAFDSAGRVRALTPQLVERYGLAAPLWPVAGAFVEARLFAVSTGGRVLVVTRPTGAVERYPLSDADVGSLAAAIDAAVSNAGGGGIDTQPTVVSEPARNAFVRNQLLLALGVYGPLLATLADDGQTATALYLLGAGSAVFASLTLSRGLTVTRAQNHLATDGALRGYGATAAMLHASRIGAGRKMYSALGLAGALGGSIYGYHRGRNMTDAEAEASTTISTLAAAVGFGATAAIAGLDGTEARHAVGAMLGTGLVGYALGPRYPRRARYNVTRGDVQMLSLASILGAAVALVPIADTRIDHQAGFGIVTAGLLAGAAIGDRALVRGFDYGTADATQVQLATVGGALMGTGVGILTEPDPQIFLAMVVGGAVLGAMAGHAFAGPPRAGAGRADSRTSSRIRFDPSALALAASRTPGNHPLLSLTF